MNTYTPHNILTIADYEKIQKREPWTESSLYKPVKDMSFKHFIYSFGDYMLKDGLHFYQRHTEILSETQISICKAYYETACEMNLTYFEFRAHFVGLQYRPSEDEAKWFEDMDETIVSKMKEKFSIETEISQPYELWKCLHKLEG